MNEYANKTINYVFGVNPLTEKTIRISRIYKRE